MGHDGCGYGWPGHGADSERFTEQPGIRHATGGHHEFGQKGYSNTDTANLTITGIQITGDFGQTNNCGSSLGAGLCTINVTFTPTASNSRTGTLSINDNASPSPQTVSLSGTGTVTLCDPTSAGCSNTLQTEALRYEQQLGQILQAAKIRWPNLSMAFLSTRIYGGYAATLVSPEPYAYEYGFSTKWAIQAQINQIRPGAVDPVAGNLSYTVAPWIAWGPYLWTNGANPRSDGLTWCDGQTGLPCNGEVDFLSDGEHESTSGLAKTTNLLMNFFLSSPVTTPWFVAH